MRSLLSVPRLAFFFRNASCLTTAIISMALRVGSTHAISRMLRIVHPALTVTARCSSSTGANTFSAPPSSVLERFLNNIRCGKVRGGLTADDLFRICGLIGGSSHDTLGLVGDTTLLLGLAHYYKILDDQQAVPPFQRSLIEKALGVSNRASSSSSSSLAIGEKASAEKGITEPLSVAELEIDERVRAIWDIVTYSREAKHVSSTDLQKINRHCDALKVSLRSMSRNQVENVVKALAVLNYQNYDFVSVLARRCCEVAPQWNGEHACKVLFNLLKLNVQDSLVAILNRIDASATTLSLASTFLFFQAMERQPNTSAAAAKIVPKVATRAAALFTQAESVSYHRAFLVCMSRYGLGKHPSVVLALRDCSRFLGDQEQQKRSMADESSSVDTDALTVSSAQRSVKNVDSRDLLPILFTLVDLGVPATTEGVGLLLAALHARVQSMDHHNLHSVVEFLSVFHCPTTTIMSAVLDRMENDCAKLSISHFIGVLEMIASYPPARTHPCIARFAFAGNVLKETLDADGIERFIGCLLEAGHLSDDFFSVCEFAHSHRQGVARNAESLMHLLQVTTPEVAANAQWKRVLVRAVESLAAVLRDDELAAIRGEVTRLRIQDPNLQQKIFGRMRSLKKEAGVRQQRQFRRGYDPVDDL